MQPFACKLKAENISRLDAAGIIINPLPKPLGHRVFKKFSRDQQPIRDLLQCGHRSIYIFLQKYIKQKDR